MLTSWRPSFNFAVRAVRNWFLEVRPDGDCDINEDVPAPLLHRTGELDETIHQFRFAGVKSCHTHFAHVFDGKYWVHHLSLLPVLFA
jgi:hypothetical protein